MPTYFGNNSLGNATQWGETYSWWRNRLRAWTCPGSGTQDIKELAARVGGDSGFVRCAVYTTGNAFITQGSAKIALPASIDWVTHASFVDQSGTPHSPTLVGGTNYVLVENSGGAGAQRRIDTQDWDSDSFTMLDADYTDSGYPATIVNGNDYGGYIPCIRCGVDPAAAGPVNLKTLHGLAKASVKTIQGTPIASIKTLHGLN